MKFSGKPSSYTRPIELDGYGYLFSSLAMRIQYKSNKMFKTCMKVGIGMSGMEPDAG